MIVVVFKYLTRAGIAGLTVFPFVFLCDKRHKKNVVLMNHERIHLRQQLEMGIFLFYIWYGVEFVFRRIQLGSWHLAYRNISFEREAYANEERLEYLAGRRFWVFLEFLV